MADEGGVFGIWLALVEQGFKSAGGTLEKEGFDSVGHVIFYHKRTVGSSRCLFLKSRA